MSASAGHRVGQRLGRFRLLGELGRGAQATVWRAHDERLDREVAVKLLNRTLAGAGQPLSAWLHEARVMSRLAHAHIVPVFDADEIDGQPLLVLELVTGQTLAEALRQRGALPAREAVELMLGVVDALRAAHALGIVHRDLKLSLAAKPAAGDAPAAAPLHSQLAADRAASLVLGLSFEALGMGVAQHWGLPDTLQRCMRRPQDAPPIHALPPGAERLRWLAVAANEVADALWQGDDDTLKAKLDSLAHRHGPALGLNAAELWKASGQAQLALSQMASAMGLALPASSSGQRLLIEPERPDMADSLWPHQLQANVRALPNGQRPDAAMRQADGSAAALAARAGHAPEAPTERLPAGWPACGPGVAAMDVLAAGIHDITETLAGDSFKLNQVLRMVLETMMRAHGFRRMVFCLRDKASGRLTGRFGLGDRAAALSPLFQMALQWPAGQPPDLFGAVCLKARDTLIADTRLSAVAQRLPAWYRQQVDAASCLLLPMLMKGAPFALIYADHASAGQLLVGEQELALLRTLRNQALMAFKQTRRAAA